MQSATISINPPKTYDLIIDFNLEGSTGKQGLDFDLASRSILFPAGSSQRKIDFNVLDDGNTESGHKTLQINLTHSRSEPPLALDDTHWILDLTHSLGSSS